MTEVLVNVEQGNLKGASGNNYYGGKFYKFLGIPYAKAPIGELRFKAPQPPEPWKGVRDATKEGPECPAADMYFTYFIGNENNCLNLNVYTNELPKDNNQSKKPVMVWIHGGAFMFGSNKSELYGPDYLMTQDIVLVAINYRLGIFGFASFNDSSLEVPGNAGLKDMRMALKWIQKNINTFGGDPENVTIFGESAGGASVHYLTLSPSTEGLFHKAIFQSGSALNNWAWGKNNSGEIAKCFQYKETDEKKILEKLKKESAKSIVNAQKKILEKFYPRNTRPWGPVVEPPSEDAFLTEEPTKIMHSRGAHKIPMIIGYNSREGMFFELVRKTVPGVQLPKDFEYEIPYELGFELGSETSKEIAEKVKKNYFGDAHCKEENIDQVYLLKGDTNFIHPIHRTIKLQNMHSDQPVYAYRMSLNGPLNYFQTFALSKYFKTAILFSFLTKTLPVLGRSFQSLIGKLPKKEMKGVSHADDLFHLFPTFFTPPIKRGSEEDIYIQRFVTMWTNFARFGEPTPDKEHLLNHVKWTPLSSGAIEFLDIGNELKMIENIDGERLKFWDELYDVHLKL